MTHMRMYINLKPLTNSYDDGFPDSALTLLSMLNWLRSRVSVARRSLCVSAPRLSSRLETVDANRRSPASSEIRKMYCGALTWFERCVRPGKYDEHDM